jgi:hypothetical protein
MMAQKIYTPPSPNAPTTFPPPGTCFPSTSGVTNGAGTSPPPQGMANRQYDLSPLQQREMMQKEAYEKERLNLIKKAAGDQGESVERLMAKYLAV